MCGAERSTPHKPWKRGNGILVEIANESIENGEQGGNGLSFQQAFQRHSEKRRGGLHLLQRVVRKSQCNAVGQSDGRVIAGFLENGLAAEPVSLLQHADLIGLVHALNGPADQHHQRRIGRVALAQQHRVRSNQREREVLEKRGNVRLADGTQLPAGIHEETEKEAATDVRESRFGVHRGD